MGHCYTRDTALFVLADGLGGHPDGEVAAQLALQTMAAQFRRDARPYLPDVAAFLAEGLMAAHDQISRYGRQHALHDTPRTTLVAAVIQNGELTGIHSGDSRLYVVRDGALTCRTRDHSHLEAKAGPPAASGVANRHALFTCLGAAVRPLFDITGPIRLVGGDRVLLCSDGLWGVVPDEMIVRVLGRHPVSVAAPELVEQALQAGGAQSDNVTAIVLEWEAPQPAGAPGSAWAGTDRRSDDTFSSTIQAEGLDGPCDALGEDTIEPFIAEVNDTIQRGSIGRR